MIQTVNLQSFIDSFRAYNRFSQFGYDALVVLFDYLEQYENDTGEPIELDVIGLCCEYTYANAGDIINDYQLEFDDNMTEEELNTIAREYLEENTIICGEISGGFIYCTSF